MQVVSLASAGVGTIWLDTWRFARWSGAHAAPHGLVHLPITLSRPPRIACDSGATPPLLVFRPKSFEFAARGNPLGNQHLNCRTLTKTIFSSMRTAWLLAAFASVVGDNIDDIQWHIVLSADIVCQRSVDSPWPAEKWKNKASGWRLDVMPEGMHRCTLAGRERYPLAPGFVNLALLLDAEHESQRKRVGVPCFAEIATHKMACCYERAQVFGRRNHHWHNCTQPESATP